VARFRELGRAREWEQMREVPVPWP
jgi:hypothetical protein